MDYSEAAKESSGQVPDQRQPVLEHQEIDENIRQTIFLNLEEILKSAPFRSSNRSRQFLSYVVRNSLEGHPENLKERTIGIEVFNRTPNYLTGEDPVVRINAGEVRRRLEEYYHGVANEPPIRIEIPRGAYIPEFRFAAKTAAEPLLGEAVSDSASESHLASTLPSTLIASKIRPYWIWLAAAVCLGIIVTALSIHWQKQRQSALDLLWSPVFDSSRPVLICIPHVAVYRPSIELYRQYAQNHPGTFQTELDRLTKDLPLDPNAKIAGKDIELAPSFGLAAGDVSAGFAIESRLTQMGKANQLRIGDTCSFEDLRNFSAVVIGAYDSRWTMEMASNLHYVFEWNHETQDFPRLKENVPSGRVWTATVDQHLNYSVDYAVVTRLVDSNTGQLLVSAAGLGTAGTEAAGEFVSSPVYLEQAMRNQPKGWNKKNLQIIVHTKVVDAIPGPPQVDAVYIW